MTKNSTIIQSNSGLENAYERFTPSDAKLRLIIDTIPVIAWWSLPDGSSQFKNQQWQDYTGMPLEAARGWGWKDAIHPEDWARIEKKWLSDVSSGQAGSVELRLRRFDGEYRWFLARYEPLRDENGKIVNWYGTGTDIDDLKRAERRLRESEQEFHRITDFIPQAITVLSPDGAVLYANRVALEQTGLTLDEVKKRSFFLAAFHPGDIETLRAKRDAGLASGEPFELDLRQIRKSNGEHQWRLVQVQPNAG